MPGASAGRCPGAVQHVECKNTVIRVDYRVKSGWEILHHKGIHNHPWPQAKKPNPLAKEALKNQIALNPKAGAFQLKVMSIFTFHSGVCCNMS
jgi:hypothetical protein